MLNTRLNHKDGTNKTHFTVIEVMEHKIADEEIKSFLNSQMLEEYVGVDFLINRYKPQDKTKLIDFLEKNILPDKTILLSKNIWQGDLGEILAKLIVSYYRDLLVPAKKLRLKRNKDKSVFGIDMIAHNKGNTINNWIYYEIKTKQDLMKKLSKPKGNPRYITLVAYDGLEKDFEKNCEATASHLSLSCYENGDYAKSALYGEIVDGTNKVEKHYEIFVIGEKSTYKEDILDALDSINPSLSPLNVTVVLIDGFKKLIEELRSKICDDAVKIVYS